MAIHTEIFAVVATGVLLIGILELVRQRRLLERYAILWLFAGVVLLVLGIWSGLLKALATAVGIFYPPTALFVIAFGFVLILLLHFSVAVSRLAEQSKILAQRLALLEERQRAQEQAAPAATLEAGAAEPPPRHSGNGDERQHEPAERRLSRKA